MTGYIKIENSIAQQVNYDDIAQAHGWVGYITLNDANGTPLPVLDSEGNQAVDSNGQAVYQTQSQTSQEFIAGLYKEFSNTIAARACEYQQELQGKLNYNAKQMTELFRQTTAVTWEAL